MRTAIISFQIGVRSPGASLADSLGPFEVRRAASLELRGLAGRSLVILGMESFADARRPIAFMRAINQQNGELISRWGYVPFLACS